ncbi:hypothetical protein T459_21305 [Capsicum annuum]|uniref:Uncharacterized protein n=2 Tax=Capsicum TaxID=4071 RepID=A0A2G2YW80_CAPAN|nr:hypothetical protein T459_21305 [Capsicum annuum]
MRNITVGELAEVRPPGVTVNGIEKVRRIVEVLKYTTHNGFPVVDVVITRIAWTYLKNSPSFGAQEESGSCMRGE